MYVTSHSQLCLKMYHLVFPRLEQLVEFADWMGFYGFSIICRLKWWSSSFSKNKFRFDCWLQFLHNNRIAHRDLKPANILASNKHYGNITDTAELNIWPQKNNPLLYKLTDFGESTEAVGRRCFVKKVFLKIGLRSTTLLKKRLWHRCFPRILRNF